MIALAVTGAAQSIVHLDGVGDLTATPFGRVIVAKVVLLAGLIGLGALRGRHVVPRLRALAEAGEPPGDAARLLRGSLSAEVVLVALVLVATALLVGQPPAGLAGSP